MKKELKQVLRDSSFVVNEKDYMVLKIDKNDVKPGYFMLTHDSDETTVILSDEFYDQYTPLAEEGWFKLIEIRVSIPFLSVGFLAEISTAIASCGLTLLIVSTFSKDYILVRKETASIAIDSLKQLGLSHIQL